MNFFISFPEKSSKATGRSKPLSVITIQRRGGYRIDFFVRIALFFVQVVNVLCPLLSGYKSRDFRSANV